MIVLISHWSVQRVFLSDGCGKIHIFFSTSVTAENMADKEADPNCVDPICHSKVESLMSAFGKVKAVVNHPKITEPPSCPLDRDELGRSSWNLVREGQ